MNEQHSFCSMMCYTVRMILLTLGNDILEQSFTNFESQNIDQLHHITSGEVPNCQLMQWLKSWLGRHVE